MSRQGLFDVAVFSLGLGVCAYAFELTQIQILAFSFMVAAQVSAFESLRRKF